MKKVLLATDGSKCAEEAAWFLSHLPHQDPLELHVLTVLQFPYNNQGLGSATAMSETVDRQRAEAQAAFERVASMFEGANATVTHVVREGHRGQMIVEAAEEMNADLIVIGARGHSAVRRLLLGSTSDYVATQAPCSVLVVRPTGIREEKRPVKIALGYVDSTPARAALDEFSETTWGTQSDVHVVSIVSYVSAFLNEIVVDTDEAKQVAQTAVEEAAQRLREVAPTAQAELVESDHVGEGLVEFVEQNQCDLIVVGDTPHSALGRVLLGSVSRFVLRHAPCSVWITRNRVTTTSAQSSSTSETQTTQEAR